MSQDQLNNGLKAIHINVALYKGKFVKMFVNGTRLDLAFDKVKPKDWY